MVRWNPLKSDYSDSGKGDLHDQTLLELAELDVFESSSDWRQ